MKRVVIVGPGGAGKSTVAKRLSDDTGVPLIELDKIFWGPDLAPTPREQWIAVQCALVEQRAWIMDGDLGPYDAVDVRLRAADTVIFLDFSIWRCAWRAFRRSRERADFWLWLLQYRRKSRPALLSAIAQHATGAAVHMVKNPRAVNQLLAGIRLGHMRHEVATGTEPPGGTAIPGSVNQP
jgi:hypothetical protein